MIDLTDLVSAMRKVDASHEPSEANDLLTAGVDEILRLRALVLRLRSLGARDDQADAIRAAIQDVLVEIMHARDVLRNRVQTDYRRGAQDAYELCISALIDLAEQAEK
jgi:uncharacterized tellurite resistance protein B-like protein